MEIRASSDDYLVFTPLFSEAGPMPAVYVRVVLAGNDFAGGKEQLALEHAELERFLVDLERLERDRRGAATLTSMSPHEFALTLSITDRAGHVLLTGELKRHVYVDVNTTPLEHHVALGFAVDPTALPRIVRDVQELLAFRRPNPRAFPEP
jgi:hypothetical protein